MAHKKNMSCCPPEEVPHLYAADDFASSTLIMSGYASVMRSTTSYLDVHVTYLVHTDLLTPLSTNVDNSDSRASKVDKHYVCLKLAGTPNKFNGAIPTTTTDPISIIIQSIKY